jgi:hypothetical protein
MMILVCLQSNTTLFPFPFATPEDFSGALIFLSMPLSSGIRYLRSIADFEMALTRTENNKCISQKFHNRTWSPCFVQTRTIPATKLIFRISSLGIKREIYRIFFMFRIAYYNGKIIADFETVSFCIELTQHLQKCKPS